MIIREKTLASSHIPGDESLQQEGLLLTHLLIISAKIEGEKRSEQYCRENETSFHQTYYLVNDNIKSSEQPFRPHLSPSVNLPSRKSN